MRFRRMPRLAMALCARDEQRFLRENLSYHRAVGVERTYVFLDRCSDRSEEIAAALPWVRVVKLDPAEAAECAYISDIHVRCMDMALQWARDEGFDWLMLLDADEFASGDAPEPPAAERDIGQLLRDASLPRMLATVPTRILQVTLPTRETIPCREYAAEPFHRQPYFHGRRPFARTFHDLAADCSMPWESFLGHASGKSIVRTRARAQGYDSHRWAPVQVVQPGERPTYAPLPTVERGWHAHYFVTSTEHWLEKIGKHVAQPDVWPCESPVERPIQSWKEAARMAPLEERADYFGRHVLVDEAELRVGVTAQTACEDRRVERIVDYALEQLGDDEAAPGEVTTMQFATIPRLTGPSGHQDGVYDRSPTRLSPDRLEGFHPVELLDNVPFRWSKPDAAVWIDLPPGDYLLEGQVVGDVSTAPMEHLSLDLDGDPLPAPRVHRRRRRFSTRVTIDGGSAQRLGLHVAEPPRFGGDDRDLGIALADLRLRRRPRAFPLDIPRRWAGTRPARPAPS